MQAFYHQAKRIRHSLVGDGRSRQVVYIVSTLGRGVMWLMYYKRGVGAHFTSLFSHRSSGHKSNRDYIPTFMINKTLTLHFYSSSSTDAPIYKPCITGTQQNYVPTSPLYLRPIPKSPINKPCGIEEMQQPFIKEMQQNYVSTPQYLQPIQQAFFCITGMQ